MTTFLAGKKSVWRAIDRTAGKRRQIIAAMGYLTDASALPLKRGDILVTNLSENAIRSGASIPEAAKLLIEKGVQVHSKAGLHAKIVLAGDELFVGSMNASSNSRTKLIEAVIVTKELKPCLDASGWLRQLIKKSRKLSRHDIAELSRIPRPKRRGSDVAESAPETQADGRWAKTWLIFSECWKELDQEAAATRHIKQRRSKQGFRHYEFDVSESPKSNCRGVKIGDTVISALQDGRSCWVYPPGEVWDITEPGGLRHIHFVYPKNDDRRALPWKEFQRLAISCGLRKPYHWYDVSLAQTGAEKLARDWPCFIRRPRRR